MGTGTVVGSLFARLGLDSADFDAGLDRSGDKAETFGKRLKATMTGTASHVQAAALGMKGALLGIGFAGATAVIKDTVAAVASLGDEASRAGLSLKAFQEWKYVAEQNRIGIDAMVDGFKELQLRADEFIVTGGGSAAEAFQRLGYSAADLKDKLKDPSELMLDIIERLRQLDGAAQIRIFDELLGGSGGEQFVQLIAQGADGIRRTIDQANRLGVVFKDEVVDSAKKVNQEFNKVMNSLTTWAQTEVVAFAHDIAAAWADLKRIYDLASRMGDEFRPDALQQSATIQERINAIMRERLALQKKIDDEQAAKSELTPQAIELGFSDGADKTIGDLQAKIDALNAQEDRLIEILKSRSDLGSGQPAAVPDITGPKVPLPIERPYAEIDKENEALAQKIKSEQEAMQSRLDSLRQQLMTEEEAERFSYQTRLEDLQAYLEAGLIKEAEYNDLKQRAQEEHVDKMAEITRKGVEKEAAIRSQLVGYAADIFGSLATLAQSAGDKGFKAAKAFGIAQAVINTAEGITKALAQGGVLGFAGAAAVAAAGAAQIATIASTQPGSSSRPSVSQSAADSATGSGSGGEAMGPGSTAFISVTGAPGSTLSTEQVIQLMDQMIELQRDGYKLVLSR